MTKSKNLGTLFALVCESFRRPYPLTQHFSQPTQDHPRPDGDPRMGGFNEQPTFKPTYNHSLLNPKVLVCSSCEEPVGRKWFNFYSCPTCDAWVVKVHWKDIKPIT